MQKSDEQEAHCSKTFAPAISFLDPLYDNFSRHLDLSANEVTEGALQIWRNLPEKIRHDPSLASFRQEHERLHGDAGPDEDPLPAEDISIAEENASNGTHQINDVAISITNELGQVKQINTRDEKGNEHLDEGDGVLENVKMKKWMKWVKIGILLVAWGLFTGFLMTTTEKVIDEKQLSIPINRGKEYILPAIPEKLQIGISIKGAFLEDPITNSTIYFLSVYVQVIQNIRTNFANNESLEQTTLESDWNKAEKVTDEWRIPLVDSKNLDTSTQIKMSHMFDISKIPISTLQNATICIFMKTNIDEHLPVQFSYDQSPIDKTTGVIYAAVVLLGLYIMIIWEIVHRTFAAMIASTMAIGILAAMDERPPMAEIMGWIDVETLLLLFGMMILVAILSETGIFDYLAVYAYKITNGRVWPLINCLCLFTAIMSSFLDNVTTVLLMTPVTIRLCEVMGLNPVPILMSMIIYSNIGGALTPVGDPPNVIIASNSFIQTNGVNFTIFTLHMALGVIVVMVQTYFQLRFMFRNINDLRFSEPQDVQELRHEIAVWQRAAASLSSYSKDEDLVRETLTKKVNRLKRALKKKMASGSVPIENYKQTLEELQAKYPIRSKSLLIKSGFALVFVISFFFLHSVPELQRLSLGWTALLGAILLLILADREDMDSILARVEWSTLLFFAALFILMESLSELGLIDWIGKQTEMVIRSVGEESRLAVAILLILWVSAIASAFVDNIPLTTMMVKIAISLAQNKELGLPLQPLVWALAFGACLGGNGTLIGASANVVCAGVAEQHGYRFTFIEYFKVGFPVMVGSIIIATGYLMLAHVAFQWH